MPKDSTPEPTDIEAAAGWLASFDAALAAGDTATAASLFHADGHWRDVLALTWHIETMDGRQAIADRLAAVAETAGPTDFRLAEGRTPPRRVTRAGTECLEALIQFTAKVGVGAGALRLTPGDDGTLKAWTLSTTLEDLHDHKVRLSEARAGGDAFKREWGGDNWLDIREQARAYADRDPVVLVVGGGQAGLAMAARLTHLGVDTLIVDANPRIGDNWRRRYHSLVLHNEVYVNHMPFMKFPPTWPTYIPKDLLANWFEAYVEALELNYWTSTRLQSGSYDDAAGCWTVTLERDGGEVRTMRPRHIIMATGVSAIPIVPDDLPGLTDFAGTVMHSGSYTDGQAWKGARALVLGTGNSGHDVAQDLEASGADVTMIQRASTHIVSLAEAQKPYGLYFEGPPMEDCDILAASFPFPVLKRGYQVLTQASKEVDRDLHEGLAQRGFKLNDGVDDCGFQMSYMQRGGGYYFDVGCSGLIADGRIGLMQYDDIESFTAEGLRMNDGTTKAADLLVLATGFKNMQDTTRVLLGDAVADRVGPVWGFGDDGELRNMFKRTAQAGLWYISGSLAQCRIYSRYMALQIKACEEGLLALTRT